MKVARMHSVGAPMVIEEMPAPTPRPTDVVVAVKSCGIVPNLHNILANWPTWFPEMPLPPLPAIFGLDPAGVVEAVGSQVHGFAPGDRVYVNPGRHCGSCRRCIHGDPINCRAYAFNGYFGFSPTRSKRLFEEYPYGGLAERMTAPQYSLVRLPPQVSFDQAARFGYLGTMYSAMKKAKVGPGSAILVNGISGTLGLGGALFGLAMGVSKILGTGRNRELLARVKELAPGRIEVHSLDDGPIAPWAKKHALDEGVDAVFDALGPGAPHATFLDAMRSLRRGGMLVNIGAIAGEVPLDVHWMMDNQIGLLGSAWLTTGEGQEMADMAEAGTLRLDVFEHRKFPLASINEAINGIVDRNGGFSNYVINP